MINAYYNVLARERAKQNSDLRNLYGLSKKQNTSFGNDRFVDAKNQTLADAVPIGVTRTELTSYPRSAPDAPKYPDYEAPEYDEGKVRSLTQKAASPAVSTLRQQVQQAMTQSYENPNVRRMVLRDAMAGYGSGLADIYASAQQRASQEYATQFQSETAEALQNYQVDLAEINAAAEREWNEWLQSGTQTATSSQNYAPWIEQYLGLNRTP